MTGLATPGDVAAAAKRKVPQVIVAMVDDFVDQQFPMPIRVRVRVPSGQKPRLQEFASAVQTLLAGSKAKQGSGYTVELVRRRSRDYGEQDFPDRITIDTLSDFISLTGCDRLLHRTRSVRDAVRTSFPQLAEWLRQNAVKLERYADVVTDLIAVATVFVQRPLPDCYLRELDVPVDTKFIEKHEAVLTQWLDILLPASAIDVGETKFARRYGLRDRRQHHLFRVLDQSLVDELTLPGDELSLPMRHLRSLPIRNSHAIIVENRTTLLTLPPMTRTVALGGVGDSVTRLREVAWLHRCAVILYWGDLDVDGFRILSNLRRLFANLNSVLMDEETYTAHRDKVVSGNGRSHDAFANLTPSENMLMRQLGKDNLRIEQESIPHRYVLQHFRDKASIGLRNGPA